MDSLFWIRLIASVSMILMSTVLILWHCIFWISCGTVLVTTTYNKIKTPLINNWRTCDFDITECTCAVKLKITTGTIFLLFLCYMYYACNTVHCLIFSIFNFTVCQNHKFKIEVNIFWPIHLNTCGMQACS